MPPVGTGLTGGSRRVRHGADPNDLGHRAVNQPAFSAISRP